MTLIHPLPQEHPMLLEDSTRGVLLGLAADCVPDNGGGDRHALTDMILLLHAIPRARDGASVCPSCGTPINPATGECRCSE